MEAQINWIFIIVIGILAIYAWKGYYYGFIRVIFSTVSFLIALGAGVLLGPALSTFIQEQEVIIPYVAQQIGPVEELTVPEALKAVLMDGKTSAEYAEAAKEEFQDYISSKIAIMVINSLSFFAVFLLTWLILRYICNILDLVSKLPLLNGLNKTAGIAAGIFQGIFVIWLWCIIVTIFSGTKLGEMIFSSINKSELLSLLYNNNLLLQIGKILI